MMAPRKFWIIFGILWSASLLISFYGDWKMYEAGLRFEALTERISRNLDAMGAD